MQGQILPTQVKSSPPLLKILGTPLQLGLNYHYSSFYSITQLQILCKTLAHFSRSKIKLQKRIRISLDIMLRSVYFIFNILIQILFYNHHIMSLNTASRCAYLPSSWYNHSNKMEDKILNITKYYFIDRFPLDPRISVVLDLKILFYLLDKGNIHIYLINLNIFQKRFKF